MNRLTANTLVIVAVVAAFGALVWGTVENVRQRTALVACKDALSNWQDQLNTLDAAVKAQKQEDDEIWEKRISRVDYVLWEVHEISPGPDSELKDLCTKVSLHSGLWYGAMLMGYSVFDDAHGKRQLTCRWVREKEAP